MKLSLSRRSVIIVLIGLFFAAGCSNKKESTSEVEWPAMDSFHMIMAESYHPMKDSANLAPAKLNAELMATEAAKWAGAPIPEKVNNGTMQARLEELTKDARAFADQVKASAPDSVLSAALEKLLAGLRAETA